MALNYILPAQSMHLPIYPDRPVTQPVTSVADGKSEFRDANQQQPSTYVYRGEVVEAVANDKRYRPQPNLHISPENERAIATYQKVLNEPPLMGKILDGFI